MLIFSYVLAANCPIIFLQSTIWPSHQSMPTSYGLWTSFSLTVHHPYHRYSNRSFTHGSLATSWEIFPCHTCSTQHGHPAPIQSLLEACPPCLQVQNLQGILRE